MKRIMSENRNTLPLLRNQKWKIVKTKTEKNKRIINTYHNEQCHRIKGTNYSMSP